MRIAKIIRVLGAAMVGVVALSHPAVGQGRSATLRVTAQVVDVGALAAMPMDSLDATAARGGVHGASGRVFSIVPPRHSAVALSMQVGGLSADDRPDMAILVCPPSGAARGRCRRIPLVRSLEGAQAADVTDEAVVVRLLGMTHVVGDTAYVTVTLAYPDS
jgi:hypothetical protein